MASLASDEQLLSAFLRGEEAMFAELVRRYEQPLFAFICRLTGDATEAPDLFQETFIRVFRNAASFRGGSSFKTWLYAIAANVCRSHGRKLQRERPTRDGGGLERSDPSPHPNGHAESREIGSRIACAVGGLPPDQREVFVLKVYQEMSYSEIAEAVGRPLGTVKSQMRLALARLRSDLRDLAEAYEVS